MARDAIDCRCGLYQCRAALNVCFITRPSDNGTTTPPWIPFRPDASASDVPGMERARGSAPRVRCPLRPTLGRAMSFRVPSGRRKATRHISLRIRSTLYDKLSLDLTRLSRLGRNYFKLLVQISA